MYKKDLVLNNLCHKTKQILYLCIVINSDTWDRALRRLQILPTNYSLTNHLTNVKEYVEIMK